MFNIAEFKKFVVNCVKGSVTVSSATSPRVSTPISPPLDKAFLKAGLTAFIVSCIIALLTADLKVISLRLLSAIFAVSFEIALITGAAFSIISGSISFETAFSPRLINFLSNPDVNKDTAPNPPVVSIAA